MKIYISGPIMGHDCMERFAEAEERLKRNFPGVGIINPARTAATLPTDQMGYSEYLNFCMSLIDLCDMVCMIGDWSGSRTAKLEKRHAEFHGKEILYLMK